MLKIYAIINAGVIHQSVYSSKFFYNSFHCMFTFVWHSQFRNNLKSRAAISLQFMQSFQIVFAISANNNRNSSFSSEQFYNSFADSFCAAGYDDHFIF